jgi:hypothetical protein
VIETIARDCGTLWDNRHTNCLLVHTRLLVSERQLLAKRKLEIALIFIWYRSTAIIAALLPGIF